MLPTETPSEVSTEILSIRMPASLAASIRARVQAGEFASESEAVVHDLLEAKFWNHEPDEEIGESLEDMLKGVPAQLARIDSGEEPTYTVEEVREHMAAWRTESQNG